MSLPSAYLMTTKNLEKFFNSLINAKAPSNFTQKFLESLEFKSTNDRLFINILKGLGFIDANGVPTKKYYHFLDQSQSKKILAEAIKDTYGDLFAININANEMTSTEVKNKLKTLTQGKYSDNVIGLMANTFKGLVGYAEWNSPKGEAKEKKEGETAASGLVPPPDESGSEAADEERPGDRFKKTQLHYNFQIHLPESRDQAVYDAIFKSLKKHLF